MSITDLIDVPITATAVDIMMRSLLIFGLTIVTGCALQNAAAGTRFWMWTVSFAALVAIPVLVLCGTQWQWAVLPGQAANGMTLDAGLANAGTAQGAHSPGSGPAEAPSAALDIIPLALLGIWIIGSLISVGRLINDVRSLRTLRQGSPRHTPAKFDHELLTALRKMQVSQPVTLCVSSDIPVPMTWGVFQHVIFLPVQALDWDRSKIRLVLLHELAHIKRRDCLIHLTGRVLLALLWFHPLLRFAYGRLSLEREMACDELVMAHVDRPATYASELISIARAQSLCRAVSGIGMARHKELESRIIRLLSHSSTRRGLMTKFIAIGIAFSAAIATTFIAAVQPVAKADEAVVIQVDDRDGRVSKQQLIEMLKQVIKDLESNDLEFSGDPPKILVQQSDESPTTWLTVQGVELDDLPLQAGAAVGVEVADDGSEAAVLVDGAVLMRIDEASAQDVAQRVEEELANRPASPRALTGSKAAPLEFDTEAGVHIDTHRLTGPTVLMFYASWCKFCVNSLPVIDQIADDFEDVQFVLVSLDSEDRRTKDSSLGFLSDLDVDLDVVFDRQRELAGAFEVKGYPTTVLLEQDGTIADMLRGSLCGDRSRLLSDSVAELLD